MLHCEKYGDGIFSIYSVYLYGILANVLRSKALLTVLLLLSDYYVFADTPKRVSRIIRICKSQNRFAHNLSSFKLALYNSDRSTISKTHSILLRPINIAIMTYNLQIMLNKTNFTNQISQVHMGFAKRKVQC